MEDEFSLHHQDIPSGISDIPCTHLVKASGVMQTQEFTYETVGAFTKTTFQPISLDKGSDG